MNNGLNHERRARSSEEWARKQKARDGSKPQMDTDAHRYEEEPRISRIRADKDERGEWPIRAYPRNLRLDLLTGDNRGNGDSALSPVFSVCSCSKPSSFIRVCAVKGV